MSDPHRGAYTPSSDAPLSFDARQPVRGGGQAPVTLMISAGILVVLVAAIFFVYRGGVRGANDAPQPVGTPVASIKEDAPNQVEKTDPASGLQIYKAEGDEPAPTFAPPPETPQARPTTPVSAAPLAAPQPAPVTVLKTPPSAPPPAAPVAAPAPRPTAPQTIASVAGSAVQIGAFSSQAQADAGWTAVARLAPGLAAGKGKSVQAIERDGKTLYRTAVTGFETRAAADAFCSALKAAGRDGSGCFVR